MSKANWKIRAKKKMSVIEGAGSGAVYRVACARRSAAVEVQVKYLGGSDTKARLVAGHVQDFVHDGNGITITNLSDSKTADGYYEIVK